MERLRWQGEFPADGGAIRLDGYRPITRPVPRITRPIDAVVMEMSGVLYDDSYWPRWLWQRLAKLGLAASFETFWSVCEQEYLPDVYAGRRELWDALCAYFVEMGLSRGRIEEVRIAAEARRLQWQSGLRPFPGVAATLAKLAAGRPGRLAVLTNSCCSGDALGRRLGTLGLGEFFGPVIGSRDLGLALPASDAWLELERRLQIPRSRIAFVSRDGLTLRGAAGAGLVAIGMHQPRATAGAAALDQFADLAEVFCPAVASAQAA